MGRVTRPPDPPGARAGSVGRAVDGDGGAAALPRHQQVPLGNPLVPQLGRAQAEQGVGARVSVTGGRAIGEVRPPAAEKAGRHEPGRLGADVRADRRAGAGDDLGRTLRRDGDDVAAQLVGNHQVSPVGAEGGRRDRHATLHPRRRGGDRADPTTAVDRIDRGGAGMRPDHQEPVAETAGPVEGDPAQRVDTRDRRQRAGQPAGQVLGQYGRGRRRLEQVHRVLREGASGSPHREAGGEGDIGLGAGGRGVPGAHRRQSTRRAQLEEPAPGGHQQRPIGQRAGDVEDPGNRLPLLPGQLSLGRRRDG